MTNPPPSVGRIVHYVGKGGACTAATVTEVAPEQSFLVGLFVTAPGAAHFLPLDEGGVMGDFTENQVGTWHWPERVAPHGDFEVKSAEKILKDAGHEPPKGLL